MSPAKNYIRKREAPDAAEVRMQREIRVMLPAIGARYGLAGTALKFAMESALGTPAHAYACLSSIERSLGPR